jgi:hypothetical protein
MGAAHQRVLRVNPPRPAPSDRIAGLRPGTLRKRDRLPALLALAALSLLWLSVQGQLSKNIKTKNFIYPEFYPHTIGPDNPTNRMRLLLRGALGQYISNDLWGVTTARLEHYPESGKGTNLVAISPFCLLDSGEHTVSSTGRIDLVANDGALTIHGDTGFHFDLTNHVLHVSNHNRTVILHGLSQKP